MEGEASDAKPEDRKINAFMVCGTRFDVDSRYTLVKPIGHGAYGVVCSAHDNVTGEKVAIKKINRAFDHLTDTKRTLREIRILRHFTHENVIRIRDILRPISQDRFDDVYIVSELMDTDLHQIISSPQPLTDDHCQYFLYQILRALKYHPPRHNPWDRPLSLSIPTCAPRPLGICTRSFVSDGSQLTESRVFPRRCAATGTSTRHTFCIET